MVRFPNPGSNIRSLLTIYHEIYELLKDQEYFTLDDFTSALIKKNLATSCGYTGEEALKRSTRDDRTRDPLYNQSKMYSELYKILGWIHPIKESRLQFTFTYLGAHVVEARKDPWELLRQSIIGIAYPTPNIEVKSKQKIRPFTTIIRSMNELGGFMCRDEMIIGPLSLENDRDANEFSGMIDGIKSVRGSLSKLFKEVKKLSVSLKIDQNTMWNYTRFPLGALKWTGWAKDVRLKGVYEKSSVFYQLTEYGKEIANEIQTSCDIRGEDLTSLDEKTRKSLILVSFFEILEKSGFDVSEAFKEYRTEFDYIKKLYGDPAKIMFSPFQELEPDYVQSLFPKVSGSVASNKKEGKLFLKNENKTVNKQLKSSVKVSYAQNEPGSLDEDIVSLFVHLYEMEKNIDKVTEFIKARFIEANKEVFYPFVCKLFKVLGYNCEISRAGTNYQRWDAIIIDDTRSIPMEIKSPGEEQFISVKAVRQALENKIVLLSRQQYKTTMDTTSLVVGYNSPNDRSEVNGLISDIYKAFNIVIGVIDFKSLLTLVGKILLESKLHNKEELVKLQGIIDVTDI